MVGMNVMNGPCVLVPWNEHTNQSIENSGHLFNRWLTDFGGNWFWFPIYFRDWKNVSLDQNKRAFSEVVMVINC